MHKYCHGFCLVIRRRCRFRSSTRPELMRRSFVEPSIRICYDYSREMGGRRRTTDCLQLFPFLVTRLAANELCELFASSVRITV